MRLLTVKYIGICSKCGEVLEIGKPAIYEKTTGIFCPGHEPTDPEDIRKYRQEKADAKADKYAEWAEKRRIKAEAVFKGDEWTHGDTAFNTQPGHIPERTRMIERQDRQFESLKIADRLEEKADNIRQVRVKGDASRRDEMIRLKVLEWIKPGMLVMGFGKTPVEIVKVNNKTAKVKGQFGSWNEKLIFLSQIKEGTV